MVIFTLQFWRVNYKIASDIRAKITLIPFFSRIMTPSTPAKRPKSGSMTMVFESYYGQYSLQILTQLSIYENMVGQHKTHPKGILDLWDRIEEEWNRIEPSVCQELIESMPRRVAGVIEAEGGYTKD